MSLKMINYSDLANSFGGNADSPNLIDKILFKIFERVFFSIRSDKIDINNPPRHTFLDENLICKTETALLSAYISTVFFSSKSESEANYRSFCDEIYIKIYRLFNYEYRRKDYNLKYELPHPQIIENRIGYYHDNSYNETDHFDFENLIGSIVPVMLDNMKFDKFQLVTKSTSLHNFTESANLYNDLMKFFYSIAEDLIEIIENNKYSEISYSTTQAMPEHKQLTNSSETINATKYNYIEKTKANPTTFKSKYNSKKSKISSLYTIILIILAILIFASAIINFFKKENNDNNITTTQLTRYQTYEPQSGYILEGAEHFNASELTINAAGGESCVVKLKTPQGITMISFYVRAGDTVTVGVPARKMYVYFASGDTWYGSDSLFGEETSYSKDSKLCNFEDYTWEYTLYPVNNGNFSETPIDAEEF